MASYTGDFYESRDLSTRPSAQKVSKFIFDAIKPKSVIDFGCGVGTWLSAFRDLGVDKICGIEGAWVDDLPTTVIERNLIRLADLNHFIEVDEKFDLAISLEVGEHLFDGKNLVKSLCACADFVLFSAAIPNQSGVGHINEQYQSYWVEFFKSEGYECLDVIRPRFWNDEQIKVWYRQNSFLFVKRELSMGTGQNQLVSSNFPSDVVHPALFERQVKLRHPLHCSYKDILFCFPLATYRAIGRLFGRLISRSNKYWAD